MCCLELGVGGDMGVGIQREARRVVTQHTADGLAVQAVLKPHGCEGAQKTAEPSLWQSCPRQYPEQHMQHAIWGDGVAVRRWEYILTSYFFLLRLENFYCISRDGDVAIKVFLLSAAPPPPSHLGGESLLDKSQAAPWHI